VDLIWITIPLSNFDHPYFLNSLRKLLMEGAFLVIDSAFDRPTENYWSHLSKNIRAGGALKEVALLEIQALLSRWIIENPTEKKKRTDLHFSDSRSFKKIQHLLAKISETYRQEIGVDALAQAVGLNPQYMMRLFYKTMGMTVHQFILQSRINEAKRLLIASDLKIIDVAHDCGFNSLSAFYTAFGKLTEMTPLDFRRKTHQ
jgi:AraC-like DNA-binding protein